MFLGRRRGLGAEAPVDGAAAAGQGEFLNARPMPIGMQRFLAKKGINSPEDLQGRLQQNSTRFLRPR